jgi:hypothetical protein
MDSTLSQAVQDADATVAMAASMLSEYEILVTDTDPAIHLRDLALLAEGVADILFSHRNYWKRALEKGTTHD